MKKYIKKFLLVTLILPSLLASEFQSFKFREKSVYDCTWPSTINLSNSSSIYSSDFTSDKYLKLSRKKGDFNIDIKNSGKIIGRFNVFNTSKFYNYTFSFNVRLLDEEKNQIGLLSIAKNNIQKEDLKSLNLKHGESEEYDFELFFQDYENVRKVKNHQCFLSVLKEEKNNKEKNSWISFLFNKNNEKIVPESTHDIKKEEKNIISHQNDVQESFFKNQNAELKEIIRNLMNENNKLKEELEKYKGAIRSGKNNKNHITERTNNTFYVRSEEEIVLSTSLSYLKSDKKFKNEFISPHKNSDSYCYQHSSLSELK